MLWPAYFISIFAFLFSISEAMAKRYGHKICHQSAYKCVKVPKGASWHSMFPNARERLVVKYVNRMNSKLRRGMTIAVPRNLSGLSIMDVTPFPRHRDTGGQKTVVFNHSKLAWGAYDTGGRLVNWAPASGGKNYCADVKRGCRTVRGTFNFYTKRGGGCRSSKYPIGRGGAPMPYCMFFHRGFALHGSYDVPGYHASHGCVRTFKDAARWLNKEFIDLPGSGRKGTRMIIH